MEQVRLTSELTDMIDRRIQVHMTKCPLKDFESILRDIYFQGFADCHAAMTN